MQFVDFNEEAIKCIPPKEIRGLVLDEVRHLSHLDSESELDVRHEKTIVCLSYDTGVRFERFDIAPHMAGKTKEVVHEDLINCHYARIWYVGGCNNFWCLTLNFEEDYTFPDFMRFKTREDAIKAARLCKNATILEACEILAKEFPKYATKALEYADYYKNKHGVTV